MVAMAAPAPALEMEGVVMRVTSGTTVLRHVTADSARLAKEGTQLLADGLEMRLQLHEGQTAHTVADEGIIVIGGPPAEITLDPEALTAEEILTYGQRFRSTAGRGDLYLYRKTEGAIADLENGSLETTTLIWSEALGRYVLPSPFVQKSALPDGLSLLVEGGCALLSEDFADWKYFGVGQRAARMSVEIPQESTP